jgi:hypothetical protein
MNRVYDISSVAVMEDRVCLFEGPRCCGSSWIFLRSRAKLRLNAVLRSVLQDIEDFIAIHTPGLASFQNSLCQSNIFQHLGEDFV